MASSFNDVAINQESAMKGREQLEKRLNRILALIEEAEARLGAHSVKPNLMQQLFELEEERDMLMAKLNELSSDAGEESV
jgi:type II secretory pathway component PulJ